MPLIRKIEKYSLPDKAVVAQSALVIIDLMMEGNIAPIGLSFIRI